MNKSAAKTLGVAALGAAFAATAASAASAAALPDAGSALDTVTRTVPAGEVTSQLPTDPAKAGKAVNAVQEAAPVVLSAVKAANPVGALLGGLPLSGLPLGG